MSYKCQYCGKMFKSDKELHEHEALFGISHELKGTYKFGGISFIISGILFLLKGVLDLIVGPPPSSGAEILTWTASNMLLLEIINEVLFFAAIFLLPAIIALYYSLVSIDRIKAMLGCGIIALVIPIIFMLGIVHGRLIYPVYNIQINTSAIAELVVAIFYGGLHAIYILLAIATIILSLAMKRGIYGRNIAYLGIVTGGFLFIGSDPWIIGPILVLVSQILFAAWLLAVGSKLYRMQ